MTNEELGATPVPGGRRDPDRPALLTVEHDVVTYGQLDDVVRDFGKALRGRGIAVTRLRTADLYDGTLLDVKTARLLGQLYDAVIVPASLQAVARDIELAAGVPVVPEREVAAAA